MYFKILNLTTNATLRTITANNWTQAMTIARSIQPGTTNLTKITREEYLAT